MQICLNFVDYKLKFQIKNRFYANKTFILESTFTELNWTFLLEFAFYQNIENIEQKNEMKNYGMLLPNLFIMKQAKKIFKMKIVIYCKSKGKQIVLTVKVK